MSSAPAALPDGRLSVPQATFEDMIPIHEIVATYFRAWNDPTHDGCARLLEQSCAPGIAYFDPKYTCRGVADLAARIHRSRTDAPTSRVEATSAIDGYEDTFRYAWVFIIGKGKVRVPGLDVIVREENGPIATITSFFGALETVDAGAPSRVQARWQG